MIALRKFALALAALLEAFLAVPAMGQDAPPLEGAWHGPIATPQGALTLVVHVTRREDGTLEAKAESYDQSPGNFVDIAEIAVTGDRLTWRAPALGASYDGTWDEASQSWKGTFTQGAGMPLNLVKGLPPPKPVVEGLDGAWVGVIERNGARLRQVLSIRTIDLGTFATYSSPDQLVGGAPVADLVRDGQAVSLSAFGGFLKFAGTLSEDGTQLAGSFTQANQPDMPITFTRATEEQLAVVRNPNRPQTPKEPFPYRVEEVAFDNPDAPGVRLAGTLTLPEGEGPFPAAIMLTGSGGQDRDEALMNHKPFAVIADHLTRQGIAVLRFDDRGIGQSTGDYAQAISTDHASDANAAFRWLAGRAEIRRDAIGFIGHSEGGMTAPTAMLTNDDVAYFVSLAGPGTSLIELLLSQRRLITAQLGQSQEEIERAEPIFRAMYEAMAAAETTEAGRAAALAILTPEAKTALGMPPEMDGALVVNQLSAPWLQYLLKYDPAPNLARIEVPVLALNGELDLQVPPQENLAAIRAALKDNPDVTAIELPGLNHLFQHATTGAVGEYRDIEETFAPEALALISGWISERFVKP